MHPLSFNTHLNNLGHVQNWTIMFIWVKYTAKMFAFSFFQQPLKHISELWIKKSAEEMTISYTREVSFDFYFPQSKQTCTTVKAWYKLSNESFSAWPFLFFNPLKEHETIPILLKAQVATSQVPQPTCFWKWHPDTCQLGKLSSGHLAGMSCLAILLALSCTYNITLTEYEKQPLLPKLKVATCKGLGVFWKLLFRWKGSIYKLVGGHGINERRWRWEFTFSGLAKFTSLPHRLLHFISHLSPSSGWKWTGKLHKV